MSFVAGAGQSNCDIFYAGVPRLPNEGEEVFATDFDILAGGGISATLCILSRLNVPTNLQTFLGKDIFSSMIERELQSSGVCYENLYRGNGRPVAVSSTILTAGERTFVTYNSGVSLTRREQKKVCARFANAKIVAMQIDMLDMYKSIRKENPNAVFVLDTGWRDDLSLERYAEYIRLADYYTPNRKEAMKITGTSSPQEAIRVLARYFANPIVKLDHEGCLVMKDGDVLLAQPLSNAGAVDSTGAGDAFLAGFMYGLYYGCDIMDCVIFGNITGGICVQKLGCLTSRFDEQEMFELARANWASFSGTPIAPR